MASSLSKTTVQTAMGRILSKLGIVKPVDQMKTKILNQLNISQKELWDEIVKDPAIENLYVVKHATPISLEHGTFNLSSISNYQKVSEFGRNGWGKANKTDGETISELSKDKFAEKEIHYTIYGEILEVFIGKQLPQTTDNFYLKYVRLCKELALKTDLLDVPDGYEDKLVNKVILSIGGVPPTIEPKDKK